MNELEDLFKGIGKWWNDVVSKTTEQIKTTETILNSSSKRVTVELPEPPSSGDFAGCPSGDNEYDEALTAWRKACNTKILEAIPSGYTLKASEVKEEKIVRHYAILVVEKS